jgi:hypothetical protein
VSHCGIHVFGLAEHHKDWLRAALRDVGHPVGGWGMGFNSASRYFDGRSRRPFSMAVRGDGATVKRAIEDLLANEVLGYPTKVEVSYG